MVHCPEKEIKVGFGLAPIKREGSLIWMDPIIQQHWEKLSIKEQDLVQRWMAISTPRTKKPFSIMPNFLRRFFDYAHIRFPV